MIACGMVYLLALGEIDLSVGWNWNFSAVITAKAMIAGINPWLAAILGMLFGAGLGLVNGLLTVLLRLPAIIITLGTYSMFWGLSLVVNKSQAVTVERLDDELLRLRRQQVPDDQRPEGDPGRRR